MALETTATSVNDIISLQQALQAAKALQKGKLAGIPFLLTRREREISTPTDDGKRARRKKSLLWLEPAVSGRGVLDPLGRLES